MKEIINKYKKEMKELINSKLYIFFIIIVTILGYGYFVTHVTIGMDDTCLDRYYGSFFSKNMIAAGRWGSYLIYKILGVTSFTPFWLEILTILILVVTAILISCFLKKNIKNLKNCVCILFSCLYISYSLYNEPLIFQPSNLALFISNLLTIASVIVIFEIINNNLKNKYYLPLIPILAISISMYEACCQTFLVALLITILIRLIIYKEEDKKIYKHFFIGIFILIASIILNYVMLYAFYFIGIPNELSGGRSIYWFEYGIKDGISIIAKNIWYGTVNNIKYFPVLEFVISIVIGFMLSIYYSFKTKNTNVFNIYALIIISNFALAILQCIGVLYRTSTSWGLFIASIITIVYIILSRMKFLKNVAIILVSLIILWQTKDLNQWFYSEYTKYQTDLKTGYQIAEDIKKEANNLSKPIVFVGTPNKGFQIPGQSGAQSNGLSVVWWGQKAFDDNSYELIKFINSLGYNYRKPTDEQYERGKELSKEMANYPKDGYIKEFEDLIVVKYN